jgi:hypothetical protein
MRKQIILSRALTIMVLLALTRCIAEVFRLHYYAPASITYDVIKPFLLGAIVCSIALVVITILSWYAKHTWIIVVAAVTIICLFILKYMFL